MNNEVHFSFKYYALIDADLLKDLSIFTKRSDGALWVYVSELVTDLIRKYF